MIAPSLTLGANVDDHHGVRFRVWAPAARHVDVILFDGGQEGAYPMKASGGGYYQTCIATAGPGSLYKFRIDDSLYPDPASRAQPHGVHGPSQVIDPRAFRWTDASWRGVSRDNLVIYELHIGTFTPEGTFDAAIERLDHLVTLGVSAIEIMPIASFSGTRNWGYDGVALFAPAACYGGPDGFKRLVDAAHHRGLDVILDCVYNHLGPDGNYLPAITGGRFFTDRHRTPWGNAINFDGTDSGPVRDFVLQNARYWAEEYHVDGVRLDASHAIVDESPSHILSELATTLHSLEQPRILIAEDERNERRIVLPRERGGLGLDAVWADDFHHQVRRLTAGDAEGYFAAFTGTIADLVTTLRKGWFYEGQWSEAHGGTRGTPAADLPPRSFVHCIQNHDQVGNRAMGDRLNHAVSPATFRALSMLLLLSPYTPLIWMGQEWAASTPFQYFTDHPADLGQAITEGRRDEFRHFSAFSDAALRERIPDPQEEATFLRSRLRWEEHALAPHRGTLDLYRALLGLRRSIPCLSCSRRDQFDVTAVGDAALALTRWDDHEAFLIIVALRDDSAIDLSVPGAVPSLATHDGDWSLVLATEEERFGGTGSLLDDHPGKLRGAGGAVFHSCPDPSLKSRVERAVRHA